MWHADFENKFTVGLRDLREPARPCRMLCVWTSICPALTASRRRMAVHGELGTIPCCVSCISSQPLPCAIPGSAPLNSAQQPGRYVRSAFSNPSDEHP